MKSPDQGPRVESRENEPDPVATFYFVRHGDTLYKEEFTDPQTENDLTEKGEEQIREVAEKIQGKIKPQDKVYMMASPRTRAKNTSEILKEDLQRQGHEILPLGGGKISLSNVKLLDPSGKDIYRKKDDKEQYLSDMADVMKRLEQEGDYYIKSRLGTLENPTTEDVTAYRNKVNTFLRRMVEIARRRGGDDEKLVVATHGEWLDSLLEKYFGKRIEKPEDSVPKGGIIELKVLHDKLIFSYLDQEITVEN